jgi:hypothetical protein
MSLLEERFFNTVFVIPEDDWLAEDYWLIYLVSSEAQDRR